MDSDTRRSILAEAESWIGTPYHHMARCKGVGVDCGGLLYEVYNPHYGPLPAMPVYPQDWALHTENEIYLDFIAPFVREVRYPVAGGIALLQFGRNYSHACISTGDQFGWFIHAYGRNGYGSVIKSRLQFFKLPNGRLRKVKFFEPK
jgi:cell wall-associated NlpC family hydrolase